MEKVGKQKMSWVSLIEKKNSERSYENKMNGNKMMDCLAKNSFHLDCLLNAGFWNVEVGPM